MTNKMYTYAFSKGSTTLYLFQKVVQLNYIDNGYRVVYGRYSEFMSNFCEYKLKNDVLILVYFVRPLFYQIGWRGPCMNTYTYISIVELVDTRPV